MRHLLATTAPFSFAQTLGFIRRFPPCQGEYLVTEDAVTAAVTSEGTAVAFTIHGGSELTVEVHGPAAVPTVIARAAHWVGASQFSGPVKLAQLSPRVFLRTAMP